MCLGPVQWLYRKRETMTMDQYRRLTTSCGIFVVACFGAYNLFSLAAEWRANTAAREQAINWEIRQISSDHDAYVRVWDKLLKEHGTEQAALRHLRGWAEAKVEWKAAEAAWKKGLAIRPENPPPLVNWSSAEFFEDFDSVD